MCEDLCCSGSSFATALGPVRNPHNQEFSAGGSSSGCGALVSILIACGFGPHQSKRTKSLWMRPTAQVAADEVDLAIGSDQGGSIRIPASWCGVVGLKPTYGLVPYTGACSHELTLDHLGPMARTVKDTALLLEVRKEGREFADKICHHPSPDLISGYRGTRFWSGPPTTFNGRKNALLPAGELLCVYSHHRLQFG